MTCSTCHGRGEVEAGITGNTIEYGETMMALDWRGNQYPARSAYPTSVVPNPKAFCTIRTGNKDTDYRDIWFLDVNPLVKLWSSATCGTCRGSGMR